MKPNKIIGAILGLAMVFLAIGANLSNEPSSKTSQGKIVILVVFIMGFFMFINNVSAKQKSSRTIEKVETPESISKVTLNTCPTCHEIVSKEFKVCPFCTTPLQPVCPECGKEVAQNYKVCPYCSHSLK